MHEIGWAVKQMQDGKRVRRAGWNGKGMFVCIHVTGSPSILHDMLPCVTMWTAQGQWQPGWLCSQADLLASDWEFV